MVLRSWMILVELEEKGKERKGRGGGLGCMYV